MLNCAENKWLSSQINDSFIISEIVGGRNNQGFKIQTATAAFFLKKFAENDSSIRKLENEFNFAQTLSTQGVTCIAKPISMSKTLLLSLHEFIAGSKVQTVNLDEVRKALDFILLINKSFQQHNLSFFAAESPENLFGFYEIVKHRLSRFNGIEITPLYRAELFDMLLGISSAAEQIVEDISDEWFRPLDRNYLSPSDFGFHNAIRTENELFFLDFEYAGLDSLWKLFCDFFCQPELPVPIDYAELFIQSELFAVLKNRPSDVVKTFKLTQLKWCLIMLNEFLPEIQARRCHSMRMTLNKHSAAALLRQQLIKCKQYFNQIEQRTEQLQQVLTQI